MKQTAVEWLVKETPNMHWEDPYWAGLFERAKEIEKQYIIEAFTYGVNYNKFKNIVITPDDENYILGKKYYNETFNK